MSKSILIVDDQPAITVGLMTRLQSMGFQVFHAINGLAGFEAAVLHEPDLIVMDISMPDIDGFDAIERIRRTKSLRCVPVIFLSGRTDMATQDRVRRAGAAGFVAKPYDLPQLAAAIESALTAGSASASG